MLCPHRSASASFCILSSRRRPALPGSGEPTARLGDPGDRSVVTSEVCDRQCDTSRSERRRCAAAVTVDSPPEQMFEACSRRPVGRHGVSRDTARPRRSRRPEPEQLERRTILSVSSMVDASGLLRVVSEASDAIAIGRVGNLVRINGANPDTGPALCAAITAIEVQGGTGPNVIDVKAVTAAAFTALTDVGIDGGGGADTLTGPSGPQTWTLLSRDAGTIAGSTPSPSFHFTAIEDLVGGGGNNRFVLTDGGTLTGSITGGSVPATLDYGDVTADIQVALSTSGPNGFDGTATGLGGGFRGIDTLVSGTGYDRLIGEAPGGVWRLAAPSTYADGTSTLTFSGFKSIEGGAGPNQFDLLGDAQGNLTADLHGGAGANVFRFHGAVILTGTITGSPGSNTIS